MATAIMGALETQSTVADCLRSRLELGAEEVLEA